MKYCPFVEEEITCNDYCTLYLSGDGTEAEGCTFKNIGYEQSNIRVYLAQVNENLHRMASALETIAARLR